MLVPVFMPITMSVVPNQHPRQRTPGRQQHEQRTQEQLQQRCAPEHVHPALNDPPPPYSTQNTLPISSTQPKTTSHPHCCQYCGKQRDPNLVPKISEDQYYSFDCFECILQADGLVRNGEPGICRYCQWELPGAARICDRCLVRVEKDTPIPDQPLLHYCSACRIDMYPPSAKSLPRLSRLCHICYVQQREQRAVRRAEGYFCKICRVCGWQAGQFTTELLKGEDRFGLCYNCEMSGDQSFGREGVLSRFSPRKWSKVLPSGSKVWATLSNGDGLNWSTIPVRRYSLARRDRRVPED